MTNSATTIMFGILKASLSSDSFPPRQFLRKFLISKKRSNHTKLISKLQKKRVIKRK